MSDALQSSSFHPSRERHSSMTHSGSSYGRPTQTAPSAPIGGDTEARYLVPVDDELELRWIEVGFDDSQWAVGSADIGFDRKEEPNLTDLIQTDVGDALRYQAYLFYSTRLPNWIKFDTLNRRFEFHPPRNATLPTREGRARYPEHGGRTPA